MRYIILFLFCANVSYAEEPVFNNVLDRMVDSINSKNLDTLAECFAPESRDKVMSKYANLLSDNPDMYIRIKDYSISKKHDRGADVNIVYLVSGIKRNKEWDVFTYNSVIKIDFMSNYYDYYITDEKIVSKTYNCTCCSPPKRDLIYETKL